MKIKTIDKIDKFGDALKAIHDLVKTDVLVGIPDDKSARKDDGGGASNAQIAYVHEFGSPAQNIPERPFLRPGIKNAKDEIAAKLEKASQAALNGKPGEVLRHLNGAGFAAMKSVKSEINKGEYVPLDPKTIRYRYLGRGAKGLRKGEKEYLKLLGEGKDASTAQSEADIKPLLNSRQMFNAITYVVREK